MAVFLRQQDCLAAPGMKTSSKDCQVESEGRQEEKEKAIFFIFFSCFAFSFRTVEEIDSKVSQTFEHLRASMFPDSKVKPNQHKT